MTNQRIVLAAVLVLVMGLVSGCAGTGEPPNNEDSADAVDVVNSNGYKKFDIPNSDVLRFVDEEAGVVCYKLYSNGIDCLPLNETDLGNENDW